MNEPELIKVRIPLEGGVVAGETLWAEPVGEGRARLANIPFLATGFALDDIVAIRPEADDFPTVTRVVHPSGDRTWMVQGHAGREEQVRVVAAQLRELGCRTERAAAAAWSVSVPAGREATVHALLDAHRAILVFDDE